MKTFLNQIRVIKIFYMCVFLYVYETSGFSFPLILLLHHLSFLLFPLFIYVISFINITPKCDRPKEAMRVIARHETNHLGRPAGLPWEGRKAIDNQLKRQKSRRQWGLSCRRRQRGQRRVWTK